jgi:hypothetical protein
MKRDGSSRKGMRESAGKLLSAVCLATGICLLPVSVSAFHVAFSEKDLGSFPSEWKARESAGKDVYSVQRDGSGVFLHAESVDNAHMIGHKMSVDLEEYPFLQFSWRPLDLPTGGNEETRKTNDGALGVYIVFEGWSVPPRTIKYVWSSTLPEGSETVSPFSKRAKIVVLRSGRDGVGQWKDESVNVLEDYRRLFEVDEVPRVRAIGVLTDSDNTDTRSSGDYRFFQFSKAGEKLAALGR